MGVFTSTKQFRLGLNLINPWWLSGASIDLDLDNGRYYDSSLSALKQPLAVVTDYLSCSRASTGYAKTSAGTLTQFGNNALRLTDLGLLVENARTNIKTASQDFTDTGLWNANFNLTITGDQAAAPDGTITADKLLPTATNSFDHLIGSGISSAVTASFTWSCYFKAAGYNYARLAALTNGGGTDVRTIIDLTSAAVTNTTTAAGSPTGVSTGAEQLANGWVRTWITMDATGNATIYVGVSNTSTNTSFGGDGTSAIYAWGAQVEAGSFPSSYILTTTTSATRAADAVTCVGNLNTILSTFPHSEVADVDLSVPATGQWHICSDGTGNEDELWTSGSDTVISTRATGVGLNATLGSGLLSTGAKVGIAITTGARSLVGGGGTVASDANTTALTSGQIGLGSEGGVNQMYGFIRRLTVWNSKLADGTLQALTAP